MSGMVNCRFCSFLEQSNLDPANRPWIVRNGFAGFVSKGALVPGWTLVCPCPHYYNMAENYGRDEFIEFTSEVVDIVQRRYGSATVFEHGATHAGSATGCGTDHAHLHVVPLGFSVEELVRAKASHRWAPCAAAEVQSRTAGREYLFVADSWRASETRGSLAILENPSSQFFRRLIAERLGLATFYDYRQYPMDDIARASHVDLLADAQAALA